MKELLLFTAIAALAIIILLKLVSHINKFYDKMAAITNDRGRGSHNFKRNK